MKLKGISLFANIGVAEAYFKGIGINVCIANEIIKSRANLYSEIYPETEVIEGDFTDVDVFNKIKSKSLKEKIDFIREKRQEKRLNYTDN